MSVERLLRDGQAAMGRYLLTDRGRITKPGDGPRIRVPETGQYIDPPRVTVYEGPCRIQVKADINSNVVEATAGDREATYLTAQLQLPVNTPPGAIGSVNNIDVDYVLEVLAAPHSPTLVGTQFNIQGTYHKSQAVYGRYRVRELVA